MFDSSIYDDTYPCCSSSRSPQVAFNRTGLQISLAVAEILDPLASFSTFGVYLESSHFF